MMYRQKHLNCFHLTCFDFIGVGVSCKNKGCTILCLCLFFGSPFKYRVFVRSLHHDLICMVIYIRLNVKVIWHFFIISLNCSFFRVD